MELKTVRPQGRVQPKVVLVRRFKKTKPDQRLKRPYKTQFAKALKRNQIGKTSRVKRGIINC